MIGGDASRDLPSGEHNSERIDHREKVLQRRIRNPLQTSLHDRFWSTTMRMPVNALCFNAVASHATPDSVFGSSVEDERKRLIQSLACPK